MKCHSQSCYYLLLFPRLLSWQAVLFGYNSNYTSYVVANIGIFWLVLNSGDGDLPNVRFLSLPRHQLHPPGSGRGGFYAKPPLQRIHRWGDRFHVGGMRRYELTDAQWGQIAPLLPPQKPRTGRPAEDHR